MRIKQAVKTAALAVGRLMPRAAGATPRIVFCYHSVHPSRPVLSTPPDIFERHLQWLTEHCRVASFADVVMDRHRDGTDKPLAAITFDDGYDDNHAYALPLLRKWDVPATFFLTAGFLERDPAVLRRLHHLLGWSREDIRPLAWDQVRELRASGMDIGSHTYSHPNLARLTAAEAQDELRRSKDVISDRIGQEVELLAYPFGKPKVHFTDATARLAEAAGYRMAAAVIFRGLRASDSLFAVPRFFADGDTLTKLQAKIHGAYALLAWWQEHTPVSVMKRISPADFQR
jgi:peptidoglycan/xylan/chitin deacetylase (PgdA/CDA1 family)